MSSVPELKQKWLIELWDGSSRVRQLSVVSPDDLTNVFFNIGNLLGVMMSGSFIEIQNKTITIRFKDEKYKGY